MLQELVDDFDSFSLYLNERVVFESIFMYFYGKHRHRNYFRINKNMNLTNKQTLSVQELLAMSFKLLDKTKNTK